MKVLSAIDGLRVTGTPSKLDALLARHAVGATVTVHAFRRDELFSVPLTLQATPPTACQLTPRADAPATLKKLREAWLRQD